MKRLSILIAALGCVLAPTAQAQFSDNRVKVGVLSDLGGQHTDNTGLGSVVAAELAVEDVGGSINGVPIEVISADTQNNKDVAADIARKWYDQGVDIILDLPNSAVALAVQKVAKEKNKLVIISSGAASDITGKACTPVSIHWTYDTYALAKVTSSAIIGTGGKNWFFITADYAFGYTLEQETAAVVKANGGTVVGSAKFPLNNTDFSGVLMQAMQSKADVLALASAGADTTSAISQAADLGVFQSDKKFAALLVADKDIDTLGLPVAQGIMLTSAFYWDMNDQTRAFAARFSARRNNYKPNMYQAGVASAVLHYLKAVKAAGTDGTEAVMAKMRELPVDDFMTKNGKVREDGRVIRDMYLFKVKAPAESKGSWDYYSLIKSVPGDQAFRPLAESECPLVKK